MPAFSPKPIPTLDNILAALIDETLETARIDGLIPLSGLLGDLPDCPAAYLTQQAKDDMHKRYKARIADWLVNSHR